jgi:hypothetical protein
MGNGAVSGTRLSLLSRLRKDPQDSSAWDEFVGRYGPRIEAWCRRWGLQEADVQDVTQTVLVRLATKLRGFVHSGCGAECRENLDLQTACLAGAGKEQQRSTPLGSTRGGVSIGPEREKVTDPTVNIAVTDALIVRAALNREPGI